MIDEYPLPNSKGMALEKLMTRGWLSTVNQEISSKWGALRKGGQMYSSECKPPDVAYDALSRKGAPMHYREILEVEEDILLVEPC